MAPIHGFPMSLGATHTSPLRLLIREIRADSRRLLWLEGSTRQLMCWGVLSFVLSSAGSLAAAESPAPVPGYSLLYEQRFADAAALRDFVMTDPKAWKIAPTDQGGALELAAQSKYQPPVRSPVNIALIANRLFGDFVLECDLLQTGREYGHRDMCLFFGVQSPSQFYYAHIATAADPNAHNVFIVKDQPRTNIARETTRGVDWGLGVWHRVRLERKLADGAIRVYFDDMSKPIMIAQDKNFGPGYVGFGSFDDTGQVANVRIWGPSVETRPIGFFRTADER